MLPNSVITEQRGKSILVKVQLLVKSNYFQVSITFKQSTLSISRSGPIRTYSVNVLTNFIESSSTNLWSRNWMCSVNVLLNFGFKGDGIVEVVSFEQDPWPWNYKHEFGVIWNNQLHVWKFAWGTSNLRQNNVQRRFFLGK